MVGVAQLVECKIVILVVVGSIPIVHPIFRRLETGAMYLNSQKLRVKVLVKPLSAHIIS